LSPAPPTITADRAAQLENVSLPYAKENIRHRKGIKIKGGSMRRKDYEEEKEDYDIEEEKEEWGNGSSKEEIGRWEGRI
jgi:hypothetical protein